MSNKNEQAPRCARFLPFSLIVIPELNPQAPQPAGFSERITLDMVNDQSEVAESIAALNLLVGLVSPPVNTPQNSFQIVTCFHTLVLIS